jgi:hypothetical protein
MPLWVSVCVSATILLVGLALAVRAPAYALLFAVTFFGFEGTVKILFVHSERPGHVSGPALGAAVIDAVFAASVCGLIAGDRGRTIAAVWRSLGRTGRIGVVSLALWLVASIVQTAQGGDLGRGLEGFRLTQGYVIAAVAGAIAFSADVRKRLTWLVVALMPIAAYAAVRTVVGPSDAERSYALSRPGVHEYGDVFRTVGSFSGAVGLASFLVPAAVLGFGVALADRRLRVAGAALYALALAGVVGSFSRIALLAVAVGVVAAAVLATRLNRARTTAAVAAAGLALVAAFGASAAASLANAVVRDRSHVFVDPAGDASLRIRLLGWRRSLRVIEHHPFGTGVGAAGAATVSRDNPGVTTDNSFIKVFREQGIPIGAVFLFGVLLTSLAVARPRAVPAADPVLSIAAPAAWGAFVCLWLAGDFIEQPGKILAWTLLGAAVSSAVRSRQQLPHEGEEPIRSLSLGEPV